MVADTTSQPVRFWGGRIGNGQLQTMFDLVQPYDVAWEADFPAALPAHRRRSRALGQVAVRDCLAPILGVTRVDFGHYPNGAPHISGDGQEIRLSLSHTRNMVAVLLADDPDTLIGIDIAHNRGKNFADLMERVLTKKECDWLQQDADFYHLWTLKEAALKAWGVGMRLAPWEVEILLEENPLRIVSRVGDFPPLYGATYFLPADIYLAFAWITHPNHTREAFFRPRALHLGC
jgi:phosphopantetheinyl transferase